MWGANLAGALLAALLLATVAHAQDEPVTPPARAVRVQTSGGFFTLTIPAAPVSPTQPITALLAAPVAPAPGSSYVVKPGDTLFVIAQELGVAMDELAAA
ncbi:MAG: LysM peptidoglycan-binding domain-containing protein, partial [Caldilinea sp.]|nr:LysM peptidoglycan-binding domain-containing protein [Caldilinea sp.]